MRRFIFMERSGIYIIDLNKTLKSMEKAHDLIQGVVRRGQSVLFVGTKRQAKEPIEREAAGCGMYYVTERWLGGMLTNFKTIRSSIRRLIELDTMAEDGTYEKITKKETVRLEKERARLEKVFRGIKEMEQLPGLVFIVDTKKEMIAVREANRLGIPILGVVDTNCDPDLIKYPIPGNDDAIRAVDLYVRFVSEAVAEARAMIGEGVVPAPSEAAASPAPAPAKTAATETSNGGQPAGETPAAETESTPAADGDAEKPAETTPQTAETTTSDG
jgi:small subunit ribosomal protein S2